MVKKVELEKGRKRRGGEGEREREVRENERMPIVYVVSYNSFAFV